MRRSVLVAVVIFASLLLGMVGSKASAQSDSVTAAVVGTGTATFGYFGPTYQYSGTLVGASDTALYGTFNISEGCRGDWCNVCLSVTDNLGSELLSGGFDDGSSDLSSLGLPLEPGSVAITPSALGDCASATGGYTGQLLIDDVSNNASGSGVDDLVIAGTVSFQQRLAHFRRVMSGSGPVSASGGRTAVSVDRSWG